MRAALLLGAGLLAAAGAAAQTVAPWQVEVGAGVEHTDNGSADWHQLDLALRSRFAPRSVAEITARHTRRYGFDDSEIGLGLALPLGERWSLSASAQASPEHRVLARLAGRVDVARSFDGGWVLGGGVARSLFDGAGSEPSGSSTLRLLGERYVGHWRFAAGLNRTRVDAGGSEGGWLLQADRYIGDTGRLGVVAARGREPENLPEVGGVVSTRVTTFGLVGAWPLGPGWALTGALVRTRNSDGVVRSGPRTGDAVGSSYRRDGVRVGLRYDF
ncbi:MAG TPA: YaiO family outer membrane beta-barrel protein [Methylibium sp.]|nr:YaiO family outer membrane beta-barrel protein [Methylibium sp.]